MAVNIATMGTLLQHFASFVIYGGSFRLRPYESACLRGWGLSLSDAAQDVFKRQIVLLDRYKRSKNGRTLFLFPTGWPNGKPLPTDVRFALREDESRVARVRMDFPLRPDLHADAIIVLQHGQLTSIEFSKVLPRECWSNAVIRKVTALRDVSAPVGEKAEETDRVEMPANLRWLAAAYPNSICMPPRTAAEVGAFVSSFDTKLPADYEATLLLTNGVSAGPVKIYGVGDAWTIPRPDGPFLSIANVLDVGDLAAKVGEKTGTVYLLDAESDEVRQLDGDFVKSLRETVSTNSAQAPKS
jgi:hypothetical protein